MALLNLRNISVSFGSTPLLDQINLSIEAGERICIVGRNGMGKSTLLKIIHGDIKPDDGMVVKTQAVQTARLEQDVPSIATDSTVYEVVAAGLGKQGGLLAAYEKLAHQIAHNSDEALLEELADLQHQLDTEQAWNLTPQIDHVITTLQLPATQLFSELSGGLKRRVLLGQALVTNPAILLLDEPTNHLDIEAIEWLENFLLNFEGAVVFITHDRMFMQKIATRIIAIDRGHIQSYPGDYETYLARKQHELEVEEIQNRLFDKKLAQEEVWIRQGIKARRTRNEGRVRELEKLRQIRSERREVMGKVSMQTQQAALSGKLVVEALNIHYSYQNKTLIKDFSTMIIRGDKIGIIGPNGVGKSTLLKLLLGELSPQSGSIRHGTKLEIAYFDQLRRQLDEEKTVADNISYGDQHVFIDGRQVHIMSYLQDFLFTPERARTPVKALSGGERNRLLLARLFSKPSNVLVMDEPTNDLDVETLELLEELLMAYKGTLLLVSHDRSFLNHIVTSTIVFEENGKLSEYVGGYDESLYQRKNPYNTAIIKLAAATTPKSTSKVETTSSKTLTLQQQKNLRSIEQKIENAEKSQQELQDKLSDMSLYEEVNKTKLQQLQSELQKIEKELTGLYAQWEEFM